jgi:protein-S-isoprenylcysteine O-methyltransferase Ste14
MKNGYASLDMAKNELTGTIAAALAFGLGACGVYVTVRWLENFQPVWLAWFGAVLVALGLLAFAMHRLQEHGHVWFNVRKIARGFRVEVKKK